MDIEKTKDLIRERLACTAALQAGTAARHVKTRDKVSESEKMLADAVRLYLQDLREERKEQREREARRRNQNGQA